ncbi:MAG TPA: hypothetical protein PK198_25075 [Saprospiraceae bacterium]|nr:hypothetical protein [Saprospiraceae bacterium]
MRDKKILKFDRRRLLIHDMERLKGEIKGA